MRAICGLLLIMLGLAMAVVWMPEHNGERQLAVVTDIATQGIARKGEADRNGRTFSPQTPLLATVDQPNGRVAQHSVAVARVVTTPQIANVPAATVAPNAPVAATTAIITAAVTGSGVVAPATVAGPAVRDAAPGARPGPATEMPKDELVRNLQRELKRVGCYLGDVDGDWGVGSRRAMSNFTERVNASLPVEQPDFILLTLLKGHQGSACGKGCPFGQTSSENGRCVPSAVVAAQTRRVQDRRGVVETGSLVGVSALPAAPAGNVASDPRTTVRPSSAPIANAAVAAAVAAAAAPVSPLPGRMAMGGPQGSGGAYVLPPPETSPARDAVRAAQPEQQIETADPRASQRDRSRRGAGRRGPAAGYRYGYPPVVVYRAPRVAGPSYYASAPRRGRSWTATFFGN